MLRQQSAMDTMTQAAGNPCRRFQANCTWNTSGGQATQNASMTRIRVQDAARQLTCSPAPHAASLHKGDPYNLGAQHAAILIECLQDSVQSAREAAVTVNGMQLCQAA
jgi:hypothetical protein